MRIESHASAMGLQHMAVRAQQARKADTPEFAALAAAAKADAESAAASGNTEPVDGNNVPETPVAAPASVSGRTYGLEHAMEMLNGKLVPEGHGAKGLQHALEMLQRNLDRQIETQA